MSFKDLYMVKIKNFISTTPFLLHFFKLKAAGQPATYLVDQSQNPKQPDYKMQHDQSQNPKQPDYKMQHRSSSRLII